MPIIFRTGDLLDSDADALVNTVNCVGVMGKGVALQFRKRFPVMFDDYVRRCERGDVRIGEPYLYRDSLIPPWIVNFPTKRHWRGGSRIEYVQQGLSRLVELLPEWELNSLALPPLGCGHGGLQWGLVRHEIEHALGGLDIPVEVYEPGTLAPSGSAAI